MDCAESCMLSPGHTRLNRQEYNPSDNTSTNKLQAKLVTLEVLQLILGRDGQEKERGRAVKMEEERTEMCDSLSWSVLFICLLLTDHCWEIKLLI